jgi:hypothetical protein
LGEWLGFGPTCDGPDPSAAAHRCAGSRHG